MLWNRRLENHVWVGFARGGALSPKHLDTAGPVAKDVDHLVKGMDLLQAGFTTRYAAAKR